MHLKRIILSVFAIFVFSFVNVFSQEAPNNGRSLQNIGKPTGNAFVDYMRGRSLFGINFGPTLYAGLLDIGINMMEPTMSDIMSEFTSENFGTDAKLDHYAFGLGFSYDFAPLEFMSLGLDVGFAIGEISLNQNKISFNTIPWSVNVKFFFTKKAPFGFFLSPRIGGTAISIKGNALEKAGYSEIYSHGGLYLSLELGWRVHLFPKSSADWPVQIGLDISLFELGYYVSPWSNEFFDVPQLAELKEFQKFANIRALLFPRLAITLRF